MRLRIVTSIRQLTLIVAVCLTLHQLCHAGDLVATPELDQAGPATQCTDQYVGSGLQSVTVKECLGHETICVQPQDEIWVVSTRQEKTGTCNATELRTRQLRSNQWQGSSVGDLAFCHQNDPDHITVLIVHGNNTNDEWALTRGMQFYDRMFGRVSCGRPAIRLVILSWESDQELPRPGPDYKIKSGRAVALGPSISSLLDLLGGDRPVLVGYSLGVQVVLATLSNQANSFNHQGSCELGYQVGLIAPALDASYACNCLQTIPNNPLIQRAEIFVNRHDRVVLAARVLNRKRCDDRSIEPSLIGLADKGRLDTTRFRLDDVTPEVRNRHSLVNYIQSATVQRRVRQLVLNAASQRTVTIDSVVPAVVTVEDSGQADGVSISVPTSQVELAP